MNKGFAFDIFFYLLVALVGFTAVIYINYVTGQVNDGLNEGMDVTFDNGQTLDDYQSNVDGGFTGLLNAMPVGFVIGSLLLAFFYSKQQFNEFEAFLDLMFIPFVLIGVFVIVFIFRTILANSAITETINNNSFSVNFFTTETMLFFSLIALGFLLLIKYGREKTGRVSL